MLRCLSQPAVDIPSRILNWTLSGEARKNKTMLEIKEERKLINRKLNSEKFKDACALLCNEIDGLFKPNRKVEEETPCQQSATY